MYVKVLNGLEKLLFHFAGCSSFSSAKKADLR